MSLNMILLCKISLCTELETERDSVGSIGRVLLPRLDDSLDTLIHLALQISAND